MLRNLDLAYGAMNLEAVSGGVNRIRGILTQSQLSLPADLQARLVSAEQWCTARAEQVRRDAAIEEAISQLSQSISEKAPLPELDLLQMRVVDLGGAVPEDLEQQINAARKQRDDQIASQAQRRRMLILASIVVATMASGAAAFAWLRHNRANQAYNVLSQHYASGDLAAADADVKRFSAENPYVLEREDIKQLAARVADDLKADAARRLRYESAVSAARTAIDTCSKTGHNDDDAWAPALSASFRCCFAVQIGC